MKFTQIRIFCLKICHLATLRVTGTFPENKRPQKTKSIDASICLFQNEKKIVALKFLPHCSDNDKCRYEMSCLFLIVIGRDELMKHSGQRCRFATQNGGFRYRKSLRRSCVNVLRSYVHLQIKTLLVFLVRI
jgi:hypothetical protein